MSNRRAVAWGLLACALLSAPAFAQLSGTYIIDNTQPTGGGIYSSFAAAAADLTTLGVNGPCQFYVTDTGTPYAGLNLAGPITGSSTTNTVEFLPAPGQFPLINAPAAGILQGIRLGSAVTLSTGPSNVIITGLTVTSGNTTGAAIMAVGCTNITIRNCTVYGSGTGIYFGATRFSSILDNDVSGVGNTPGTPGAATYVGAVTLYNQADDCTVSGNKIHDNTGNGIFLGGSGGTTNFVQNDVVVNNFIWNTPGLGTYPGGIALRRCGGSTIANNSIRMPSTSTLAGIFISAAASTGVIAPAEISNNIVRHEGTGACVKFEGTTTVVPTIFDQNVYDVAGAGPLGQVATTNYASLAAWQAIAAPSLAGKELGTLAAPAGFLSPVDLHITPSAAAFNSGSAVALVTTDIDGTPRPLAGIPDRGADETSATGIFAAFSATPVSGSAPLNVSFTDMTFTSDPNGIVAWSWDFDNDGQVDSTAQNPIYTYLVPGTYTVTLTAFDLQNGSNTSIRANLITVGPYIFQATTTGGGTGDLQIVGVPSVGVPTASEGYMFVSFDTTQPVGQGPFFGIRPDNLTWSILQSSPNAGTIGSIVHWFPNPAAFPTVPFYVGPGALSFFAGLSVDFVQVDITAIYTIANISNVARVTF